MTKFLFKALILLFLGCVACVDPAPPVTLVLFNGHFFTADSTQPEATAVAIRNNTIAYVGNDTGAKALADANTELIDLQGAFAMPGLIEGHGHFAALGSSLQNLQLLHTRSWAEIVEMAAQKLQNIPAGTWIEGRGWHQEKWSSSPGPTVNGYPYHDALSAVSPQHPMILYHASGHALLANAKAMELAGINPESTAPAGGRIVRDGQGKLTGVFEENAMEMIEKPYKAWKNLRPEAERAAAFDETIRLATDECLRYGITSFQDAGSEWWEIEQYERLAHARKMRLRLWAMVLQPKQSELSRLAAFPKIGFGEQFFTSRAVKAYFDGALGSYGAWLLEPYSDKPDSYGQNTTPLDTIRSIANACHQYGLQCCVHAIGDRANREVLNVFEQVLSHSVRKEGQGTQRWRIEHAQHVDPADQPRFGRLGVIASMQAIHCTSDAPFVAKRLGTERARTGAYAWRSLLDQGAHLSNGTDAPVEEVNPFACLYAAITRKRADTGFVFFSEQAMTREEALLSYTLWNAYAAFEEQEKGSLRVGKLADITVLSHDLLKCPAEDILKTKVFRTIVGGKTMYQKAQ